MASSKTFYSLTVQCNIRHGSIWPVTIPPGIPRGFEIFSFLCRPPDRPRIRLFMAGDTEQYWFPYNTKTTRFQNFFITADEKLRLFLSNHSPTTAFPLKIRSLEIRSHRANRARNVLCIKIETGRLKQFPTPGPEGLDLSRGLPWGGDVNGWNWTMHMSKVFLI